MESQDPLEDEPESIDDALREVFGKPRPQASTARRGCTSVLAELNLAERNTSEPDEIDSTLLRDQNHYEVISEIGRGGMGVVLRGRDLDLGRDVAIKVLRTQTHPNALARFIEEAQIGGQLQHPGIVPVYEMGLQADQRPFFTMKLIEGETLSELLDKRVDRTRDLPRFLTIFEQVCQAIAYAHSRGALHRDLKPQNIMVGKFGEVQVVDWGLARVLHNGNDATSETKPLTTINTREDRLASMPGSVMGTPAYMPPEQARGASDEIDRTSDVFALGAVLTEILTGEPPYVGEDTLTVLKLAQSASLDDARARLRADDIDPELASMAMECMRSSRTDRPSDASVLANRIQQYLMRAEARSQEATVVAERAKARAAAERRARRLFVALAIAVGLLLAFGGLSAWWIENDKQQRLHKMRLAVTRYIDRAQAPWQAARSSIDLARHAGWATAGELLARAHANIDASLDPELASELRALIEKRDREDRLVKELEMHRGRGGLTKATAIADMKLASVGYRNALTTYGLKLDRSWQEIGEQIRRDPLRGILIAALDDWAHTNVVFDAEELKPPLRIANAADDRASVIEFRRILIDAEWAKGPRGLHLANANETAHLKEHVRRADLSDWNRNTIRLGVWLLQTGGDELSGIEFLERGVLVFPGDAILASHLASVLQYACRPPRLDEAIQYHKMAVSSSGGGTMRIGLAQALLDRGDIPQAIAELEQMFLEEESGVAPARAYLGRAYRERMDLDRAHKTLVATIEASFDYHPAYFAPARAELGMVYRAANRDDDAIRALNSLIRMDSGAYPAMMELGHIYFGQGKLKEAEQQFRRALKEMPPLVIAEIEIGRTLTAMRRFDEALSVLTAAAAKIPRDPNVHHALGRAYLASGDFTLALASLSKAHELDLSASPVDPGIARSVGEALAALDRNEEADEVYRLAFRLELAHWESRITRDAKDAWARDQLARLLTLPSRHGYLNPDRALSAARDAIAMADTTPRYHDTLGIALYRSGLAAEALAAFARADALEASLVPRPLAAARFVRAMSHWAAGQKVEARAMFEKALAELAQIEQTPKPASLIGLRDEAKALLN